MRWVVTGASGFFGYHMCKGILERGDACVGVDIQEFPYDMDVEFYRGDVRNVDLMRKAVRGADIVVHGAAALPRWRREEIFSVNVDGTRTVLEACKKEGVPRFIFISTTAVYGIPKVHPVDESHPLKGVGPYGESKVEAEKVCGEYRKYLDVGIIRPKTFVGPVRLGIFSLLFDWIYRGKKIPIIGDGNNRYQLLDVRDLIDAVILLAEAEKEKFNDVYNVGATEFGTIRTHIQTLIDYAKTGSRIVSFPPWLVKPPLKILDFLHLIPVYEWAYETVDKDHYVSVDKIVRELGWKPKKSSEQALLDSYKWYEAHRDEIINRKGVTHTVQWSPGLLKLVEWLF